MINFIRFYDFLKLLDEPNENEYYLDGVYYELDTLNEILAHNPDRFYNIVVERAHVNKYNTLTVHLETTN